MKKDKPICPSCGLVMKLAKQFETKERGKNNKKYRIRRFECVLCGVQETIFANGNFDEMQVKMAVNKAKKI